MSHNYISAFARVTEAGDGNRVTTQSGAIPQTYQQLTTFGMQPGNTSMFPTPSTVNPTPAHSHQQTSGQQASPMLPVSQSQAQQWVQNMANTRQMLPTGNMSVGTPLLEWNGTEWIPPQQSSLAAVAVGQQVSLPNSSVQSLQSTYTLSPLTSWNPQQPQHIDNHQQSTNHNQHTHTQPPGQSVSGSSSFSAADAPRQCSQPTKQPRKRAPKPKHIKQAAATQLQPQHPQLAVVSSVSGLARSSSSEDLLSAEQLARVAGEAPSKEDVAARNTLLALAAAQTGMLRHQVPQQGQQGHQQQGHQQQGHQQQGQSEEPVLTELTTVVRPKPITPKPEPPPRPVRPFDGSYAVCPNCGTMSKNYNNCDFCKKELSDDCKMYDPVKKKEEEARKKKEKQKKLETERLLIAKLKQEQQKKQQEANKADTSLTAKTSADKVAPRARAAKTAKALSSPTTKSFYGRKVVVKDYTDSDPGWTPASRAKSRGGGKVGGGVKRGRKSKEAEVFVISSSDESEEEYYPSATRTRKMPVTSPTADVPAAQAMVSKVRQKNNVKTPKPDLTQVPELLMKCKRITMGSLEGTPKKPLHISISGVDISLETDKNVVSITLDNRDVKECLGCTHNKLPVLIFRANTTFGNKVRTALHMIDPDEDPYYDPDSSDARHKYIVGYLDDKAQISNLGWRLQEVFRAISLQYQTGGVLLRFIELNVAQHLLANIAGSSNHALNCSALQELASAYAGDDDDDLEHEHRSPLVFEGPVEKMFQFPYPPAVGAITVTNEDFFCLHDGEFLNDIVISFYLKYLTEQVLSEKDKERTFVFSTFFYTRLTQPFSTQTAKDPKKSMAEKRHARVKTWTKNLDLFSKDFIIIPINEHSHWFLAIICFPHLEDVVYGSSSGSTAAQAVAQSSSVGDDNVVSSTTSEDAADGKEKAASEGKGDEVQSTTQVPEVNDPSQLNTEVPASQSNTSAASSGSVEQVINQTASNLPSSSRETPSHENSEVEDLFGFESSEEETEPVVEGKPGAPGATILRRPCILIFDSLAGPGHSPVIKALRDYLAVEWRVRKGTERSFDKDVMRGSNVKCPQQNNYSDCGIYLLQYVESFFKNPITNWSLPMKCTKDMFAYSAVKNKRNEIQKLMTNCESEFAKLPKPISNRGRPRSTRHSIAAAQANADAQKPKPTTHETSVPEALGLAQTPRTEVQPSVRAPMSTSLPESTAAVSANTQSTEEGLAAEEKVLPADGATCNHTGEGDQPTPLQHETVEGIAASSHAESVGTEAKVAESHASKNNAAEANQAMNESSTESVEVGGVRNRVELMEVKDDFVPSISTEWNEMDQTGDVESEEMQTAATTKPSATSDAEESAMQTDSL